MSQVSLLETGFVQDTSPSFADLKKGEAIELSETFHFNDFEVLGVNPSAQTYAYQFRVAVDGVLVAGIHTIDGLESESDVVEYKDGEDGVSHTRPGNHKPGKMSASRDWSHTSEWYKWRFGSPTFNGAGTNDDAESFAAYFGQVKFLTNTLTLTDDSGNTATVQLKTAQAVPEPASLAAAMIGLAFFRRRKPAS